MRRAGVREGDTTLLLVFAAFWAWQILQWSTFASGTTEPLPASLVGPLASALPVICGVCSESLARRLLSMPAVAWVAAVLGCVGYALGYILGLGPAQSLLATWPPALSAMLDIVLVPVLQGLSVGYFCLVVVDYCASHRGADVAHLISLASLAGFAIDTPIVMVAGGHASVVLPLLPLLAAIAYSRFLRGPEGVGASSRSRGELGEESHDGAGTGELSEPYLPIERPSLRRAAILPVCYVAMAALAFGCVQGLESPMAEMLGWAYPICSFAARGVALMLFVVFYVVRGQRFVAPLMLGVVLLAAGMLLVNETMGEAMREAAYTTVLLPVGGLVVQCGYTFCEIATFAVLAELAALAEGHRMRIVGIGSAATTLAAACGMFAMQALGAGAMGSAAAGSLSLAPAPALSGLSCVTVTFLVALLLVIVSILFVNSRVWSAVRGLRTPRGNVAPATTVEEKAAEIAACYTLTRRETEVLVHLARGRSIPYIAKADTVSENTVKGQVKSIYAKIGLHSRQDLLDFFERF